MKKGLIVVGACLLANMAFAGDVHVCVVDYMAINTQTTFFKDASLKVQESERKGAADAEAAANDLIAKQSKLTDNASKLTPDQKKALEAEVIELQKKVSAEQQKIQMKMVKNRKAMMDQSMGKLQSLVKEIADKEHCTMVLRKDSLSYVPEMVDLTDKVIAKIQALNISTSAK